MHPEQINHRRPCTARADPAAKYLPEFASLKTPSGKPANLTISQILSHTSGRGGAAEMLSLLLARDASRTAKWLQEQKEFSAKATEGYSEIVHEFERVMARDDYQAGVNAFFEKGHSYYWWSGATHWYYLPGRARLVARLINLNLLRKAITTDAEPGSRAMAMYELVKRQPDEAQSWSLVCERATADNDLTVRLTALKILTDAVTADARLRNLVHVGRRTSNGPDPKEPVQNSFAQSTAARLNLSIPQVQTSFEELATALRARFEFALRLAWKV